MKGAPLTLHSYWRSSSTWRVRAALAYKGVAHELVTVNIAPGVDQQSDQTFRHINPMAQVPVLALQTTEGQRTYLTQSMAIIDYLEQTYPEPPLYPQKPLVRAHAIQAAEVVNSGIQPLQNVAVLTRLKQLDIDPVPWTQMAMHRGFQALERWATERSGAFCVGDDLSLADLFLVPQLYNARRFFVELQHFPELLRIEKNCLSLAAFKDSHPDMQPDAPSNPKGN